MVGNQFVTCIFLLIFCIHFVISETQSSNQIAEAKGDAALQFESNEAHALLRNYRSATAPPGVDPGHYCSRKALVIDKSWDESPGRIVLPTDGTSYYPPRSHCKWKIKAPRGKIIRIRFVNRIDIERSNDCAKDHLEIYDGKNLKANLIGRYCGQRHIRAFCSSTRFLFIKFRSDRRGTSNRGFTIAYSFHSKCPVRQEHGHEPLQQATTTPAPTPAAGNCGKSMVLHTGRIIGGQDVQQPHTYPWLVEMQVMYQGVWTHWCGGVLIAAEWVLTAAHCSYHPDMRTPVDMTQARLVTGEHSLKSSDNMETFHSVVRAIQHATFDTTTFKDDILLIKITPKAPNRPEVQPICLPSSRAASGVTFILAGWGYTIPDDWTSISDVLQEAHIPLLSTSLCNQADYYNKLILDGMFCAGYSEGKKDACQGDSGGPLFLRDKQANRYYVYGLVSWGFGCARPKKPGVYTDVYHYNNWIKQQMNSN